MIDCVRMVLDDGLKCKKIWRNLNDNFEDMFLRKVDVKVYICFGIGWNIYGISVMLDN